MDKKLVLQLAATTIALSMNANAATAIKGSDAITASNVPALQTISPTDTAAYIVSQFTFQQSANVALNQDDKCTSLNGTAGDSYCVTATNTKKGNRTFGGAVGAFTATARACQSDGTTVISTAPTADQATIAKCTF